VYNTVITTPGVIPLGLVLKRLFSSLRDSTSCVQVERIVSRTDVSQATGRVVWRPHHCSLELCYNKYIIGRQL
jgi:hypothetical protein